MSLSVAVSATAGDYSASEHLWYKQPAVLPSTPLPWTVTPHDVNNIPGKKRNDTWESQTLPVGNGRIGGTVYGGDRLDCVVLNEVSLWSGGLNAPKNGANYTYGPKAGEKEFGSYQPFGNLYVAYEYAGSPEQYSRALDLRKAEAVTQFRAGENNYRRTCFASRPDDVMVYTAETDKPGGITAAIALTPYHNVTYAKGEGNTIIMKGTLTNGERFEGRILVKSKGGTVSVNGNFGPADVAYAGRADNMKPAVAPSTVPYIQVMGADSLEIYVTMATDYAQDYSKGWKGEAPELRNEKVLRGIEGKSVEQIRAAHRSDFASFYERMNLDLGTSPDVLQEAPTDVRVHSYSNRYNRNMGAYDPDLEELIFNFGRYVLISGSQPGNLPVTLQGIWNNKVHAP